jgi:hypothetical protein
VEAVTIRDYAPHRKNARPCLIFGTRRSLC